MRDTDGGAAKVSPTSAGVAWTQVRNAAVSAVCRGWPVVPGTCRPDEIGFCEVGPLEDTWDITPVTDPEHAQDIWTRQPYGVLLVCGRGVDALEVPFRVVELLPALGLGVPVVTALGGYPPIQWTQAPPDDHDIPLPCADEVQRVLAEALCSGPPDAHRG